MTTLTLNLTAEQAAALDSMIADGYASRFPHHGPESKALVIWNEAIRVAFGSKSDLFAAASESNQ